jgi:hypothetical protein
MFRSIVLVALLSFTITAVGAQNDTIPTTEKHGITLGVESAELIDQLMIVMPGVGHDSREMLEEQSVKTYMMPPRLTNPDGNPATYALATCLEYYVNFDRNYKVNLSPDYIDLSLTERQIREAFAFLVTNGTVSAAIMPYGAATISPGVHATPKYQIENFLLIYREEVRERQKIFQTRKALMRGNPVLIEMDVPEDFQDLKSTASWDNASRSGKGSTEYLVVVGYDENREAFEVMGTYGSTWGRNGYLWIPYDDFGKRAKIGYVIVPDKSYLR